MARVDHQQQLMRIIDEMGRASAKVGQGFHLEGLKGRRIDYGLGKQENVCEARLPIPCKPRPIHLTL